MNGLVTRQDEFEAAVQSLSSGSALALDTEADGLHHHVAKVCLIQLASDRGDVWLIDPLAVPDLTPLGTLVADANIVKVLHGADYDVTILKRDCGFEFAGLFDTMIAARFLGREELGLQAVARDELGLHLSKSNQKDDWSRRPLTTRQETYAADDVRYLLALRGRLSTELGQVGRTAWVEEECQALQALPAARRGADPDAYLKIKGASRLPRRALAVLQELHAWREQQAQAADVPAFKIAGNQTLLLLATQAPRSSEDVRRLQPLPPRVRNDAAAIAQAVQRAWDAPEEDLPLIARKPRPVVPEAVKARITALRAWRQTQAQDLGVHVSVVLPLRLVEGVAEAGPRSLGELEAVPGLRKWRVHAFGEPLLAAVASA